jgi:hypothetical protein
VHDAVDQTAFAATEAELSGEHARAGALGERRRALLSLEPAGIGVVPEQRAQQGTPNLGGLIEDLASFRMRSNYRICRQNTPALA